jgi:transposase
VTRQLARREVAGAEGQPAQRAKRSQLQEAFTGHLSDHHGFLLARMLGRIDPASADIAEVEAKIDQKLAPFARAVDRLDEIIGVGRTAPG